MQCVDLGGRRIIKKCFVGRIAVRDVERSRGLGDVYKRQIYLSIYLSTYLSPFTHYHIQILVTFSNIEVKRKIDKAFDIVCNYRGRSILFISCLVSKLRLIYNHIYRN
mgnify:CR=1 FL=1